MEEIKNETLDLTFIQKEKDRLKNLVALAVDEFEKTTGYAPDIRISRVTEQTKCGIIKGGIEIFISVNI